MRYQDRKRDRSLKFLFTDRGGREVYEVKQGVYVIGTLAIKWRYGECVGTLTHLLGEINPPEPETDPRQLSLPFPHGDNQA